MTPTLAERSDAILAVLRGKKTYEAIAHDFGVSVATVQEWETNFIQAGTAAISDKTSGLNELQGRIVAAEDKLSQLGAVSAISQSLSAILTMDELVNTTLDTLRLVFGYLPTIGIVEGKDVVVRGGYSLNGERVDWHGWRIPLKTERSILAWVGLHGRPLNLPEVTKDPRYVYRAVKIGR